MQHDRKGKVGVVRRLRSDERGVAMVSVGLLGAFVVLISVVVAIRTLNTSTSVDQDRSFEQAIHVAESGADQALYALDTGADLAEVTLSADPTKAEVVTAAEKLAADDPTEVVTTPEGEVVVIKDATTDTAFAVGFSPGIDSANRSARVIVVDYSFSPGAPITYPDGAIVANDDVNFVGGGDTVTDPSTEHSADIHTNGDFVGNGSNTSIDGDVSASGSTVGGDVYGTTEDGADPVPFPTQEEIDAWQATLLAEAQTGPTLAALADSVGSLYVPGSFSLSCDCTLTLTGPGVVYVDGSINLSSKSHLVNNGVVLVTAENFSMSGQSKYSVTGDLATSGLVVFGSDPKALEMSGQGAAAAQGFVYVPNGGAKLSGNAAFVGSVVAGGAVEVNGNGGIIYPDGLNAATTVTPPVGTVPTVDAINEIGIGEL